MQVATNTNMQEKERERQGSVAFTLCANMTLTEKDSTQLLCLHQQQPLDKSQEIACQN